MSATSQKDEPGRVTAVRGIGILIALCAPALLIWLGDDAMRSAVESALHARFDPRLPAIPLSDLTVSPELDEEIQQAAFDQILIILLAAAAVVAILGAVMRAATHGLNSTGGKALDFTGKCLALTSAVMVGAAAIQRFERAELDVGTPLEAYGTLGGLLLGVVVVIGLMGGLIVKLTPSEPQQMWDGQVEEDPQSNDDAERHDSTRN